MGPSEFSSHEKSTCTRISECGDGRRDNKKGETCDDGNAVSPVRLGLSVHAKRTRNTCTYAHALSSHTHASWAGVGRRVLV